MKLEIDGVDQKLLLSALQRYSKDVRETQRAVREISLIGGAPYINLFDSQDGLIFNLIKRLIDLKEE